jgi:predicted nucleic acid-binding protein
MPIFRSSLPDLHVSRNVLILDTNVLYAAFSPKDQRHEDATTFLEIGEQYIVPVSVLIETWGLIVGRDKAWDRGLKLLAWINNPGNAVTVVQHADEISQAEELISRYKIDCADVLVSRLADRISDQCSFVPPVTIATLIQVIS